MNLTDPIADMLTRIRNANSVNKATVSMPSSKKLVEIARVLHEEGYIEGYDVEDTVPQKTLHITLKYGPKKAKVINGIRRISKPGLRKYTGVADMPRVRGARRPRHGNYLDQSRRHDRPRCSQAQRRRRDHRLRLVIRSVGRRKGDHRVSYR